MGPSKYRVLVVDDEEFIRQLVVSFLSKLGYSCVTAIDGEDALGKMEANKIDAVITDIKMPKLNGIILIREILQRYVGLPIMVMTGFEDEFSAGAAISAGAREFIKKPFSLYELAIRLKKMITESEIIRRIESAKDVDGDVSDLSNELEEILKKG